MKMENFLFKMGIQPIAMLVYHRVLFIIGVMDQKTTFGLPAFHYVSLTESILIHYVSKRLHFDFPCFTMFQKIHYGSLCFHFDSLSF